MNADERGCLLAASSPDLVEAVIRFSQLFASVVIPQNVIAGLDPAIQGNRTHPTILARRLDCRVKPGNDNLGVDTRCAVTAIVRRNEKNHLRSSPFIRGYESSRSPRGVEVRR